MRYGILLTFCSLLVLPQSGNASSPWCEPLSVEPAQWAENALEKGDAVFLGRVVSVSVDDPPPSPEAVGSPKSAGSMAELLEMIEAGVQRDSARFDQVATFEVLKAWVGPDLSVARTKNRSRSREFTVGETYLIVASGLEDGFYWIKSVCADAMSTANAGEYIEALNDRAPSQ